MKQSYRPYVLTMFVYHALFASALLLARRRGRLTPRHLGPFDLLLTSLAADRLSRLISHDVVTRFLREPFVELERVPGPGGVMTVQEVPEGRGLRRVIGELMTCSHCSGMWAAALLNYGMWLVPAVTEPFIRVLAVADLGELFSMAVEWLTQSSQWFYRQYTVLAPIPEERQAA